MNDPQEPSVIGAEERHTEAEPSAQKKPRPYEWQAFGILNPYGDMWSPEFFDEPEEAFAHIREYWGGNYEAQALGFKVVPVEVVVTPYNLGCAVSPPWDVPASLAKAEGEAKAAQVVAGDPGGTMSSSKKGE